MRKLFRRRPSASLAISIAALILAASGTAVAATKLTAGDSLIKKNSLSGNRLRNHTLTGTQINLRKLGKVPSAAKADSATTAVSAQTAATATTAVSAQTAATAMTAGSAPISNVTYVANTGSIPNNDTATVVTATCPAGTTVIGGGVSLADEQYSYENDSFPSGKTGWSADVFYYNPAVVTPTTATVTAICAPAAATAP